MAIDEQASVAPDARLWSAAAMPPLSERRHGRRTPHSTSIALAGRDRDADQLARQGVGLGHAAIDDLDRDLPRLLHQSMVADDVAEAEPRHARLLRAEELAGAAELEVALGDRKSVG